MQISRDRLTHRTRGANARGRASRAIIFVSVLGAVVAVMPIIAAVVSSPGTPRGARTAFASASPGEYAVVAQTGEERDTIFVAPADGPDAAIEIASIPHLRGYSATGAVSPEGRRLALVVADGGTPAYPSASLYVLNLESATLARVANGVDHLQTVAWAPDGQSIYFTRTAQGSGPRARVAIYRVGTAGDGEREVRGFEGVLGVYIAGIDPLGRLASVVIDGRGSTAYRDGAEAAHLSTQITRDWELSPDGEWLAFIESDASAGLQYRAKVVSLAGSTQGQVAAQSAGGGQQLGVSWRPGAASPTFGQEPAVTGAGVVAAQAGTTGFDVPLAYSPGGEHLAVQHWSGAGFERPGNVTLELLAEDGSRTALAEFTRFYGWAAR
ncbi:MAG: hypothetical protein DYG91_05510 [Chloroflexi bacterium CFX7]|nr:hypothetical protein [Chloroflexi bacterium CFX7]RIL01959.1 MAG: hypothetical protein DCC78_08945 [bacterium]